MIRIKVKKDGAQLEIKGLKEKLKNLRPIFIDFYAYMQRRLTLMFSRLKRGGSFRGVRWEWFTPQYHRLDGMIVPAEGGVPKMKGKGRVLGRLRHSGKRVKTTSSLMQDTGRLRTSLLDKMQIREGTILAMDTSTAYAGYQHAMRPFQFFEDPRDINVLRDIVLRKLEGK